LIPILSIFYGNFIDGEYDTNMNWKTRIIKEYKEYKEYILQVIFPVRNGFDFSKVTPEKLLKILPKSENVRGATALTDKEKIHAVLSYKNRTTQSLVWNIKYKRNRQALTCAGYILYCALMKDIAGTATDKAIITENNTAKSFIIIPMPVSAARRRERGYNQCELLAKALSPYDIGNFFKIRTDILFKKKNIKKQTFKNRRERLESMKDVFTVNMPHNLEQEMETMPIFILDDVITTGSTIQAAMDCLRRAGFENVHGISLAH
jgi:ComF family protein